MIEHVVLIKWKEATSQEVKDRLLHELGELKDKILGIVSYRVGHNFSERSLGYDAAVTSTFVDLPSLQAYGPHPEHQKIAKQLGENSVSILVVDFEPLPAQ